MNRSRSPRVLDPRNVGNGQVSYYPQLPRGVTQIPGNQVTAVTPPFSGQGHRLDEDGSDEDGSDEDGPYCPSMAHDWDGDVCKACGTTRERWDSAPP